MDAAYRFLISGFKAGSDIAYMRTDLAVTRIKDIRRRVVHEIRYLILFRERYTYVILNLRVM